MASTVLLRMYLAKLTSCWDFLPLCESRAVGARLVSASPLALPNAEADCIGTRGRPEMEFSLELLALLPGLQAKKQINDEEKLFH